MTLAYSLIRVRFVVCFFRAVVGTSNVVMLSINGGDRSQAALPLGAFFLGASLVSCTVTPWLFERWGRKLGFFTGSLAIGLLGGTVPGIFALLYSIPALFIISCAFFGASMGVGFFLRFAAVEVVPRSWSEVAVTLVVSGGCIAAFAGPESAEGTKGLFGTENLEYIGVIMMTGAFNILNAIFTGLVRFPSSAQQVTEDDAIGDSPDLHDVENAVSEGTGAIQSSSTDSSDVKEKTLKRRQIGSILRSRQFLVPMSLAGLSWAIMALPMSLLRVAMGQVGYSSRASLLTIQLHFLGMYAPGFVTGRLIRQFGPRRVVVLGAAPLFVIALILIQLTESGSNPANIATWIVGMVLLGAGWNCGFTASTIWSTKCYNSVDTCHCKPMIQAANDCGMFLFAGMLIFSASYIYEAGGSYLMGWRTVNFVVLGLLVLFGLVLGYDRVSSRGETKAKQNETDDCPSDCKC